MKHSLFFQFTVSMMLMTSAASNAQVAQLQFIHGAGDTTIKVLDIWVDTVKVAENLRFRSATSFVEVPANDSFVITVCDSGSSTPSNPIMVWHDHIETNTQTRFTLFGLSDSLATYSPYIPLQWTKSAGLASLANEVGNTAIGFVHCATTEPLIKIGEIREGLGDMVAAFQLGTYSVDFQLEPSRYRFRMEESTGDSGITEVDAQLFGSLFQDSAFAVLISGFTGSSIPIGVPSLAMHLISPSGTSHLLPASTGKVQFIHNSPDNALPSIDVFYKNQRIINNLAFRGVSGPISMPSGIPLTIYYTSDTATNPNSSLTADTFVIEADNNYLSVLIGSVTTALSAVQPLTTSITKVRAEANLSNLTDIATFNGSPDVASMTLFESSTFDAYLAENLLYASRSGYVSLPQSVYTIDLVDQSTGERLSTYVLDLKQLNLEGEAITLISSGWADTSVAMGAPDLGLWLAKSTSGKMIQLPRTVGISESDESRLLVYPNPASERITIASDRAIGTVRITDVQGHLIEAFQTTRRTYHLPTVMLPTGMYLIECIQNDAIYRQKLIVSH